MYFRIDACKLQKSIGWLKPTAKDRCYNEKGMLFEELSFAVAFM
jgi:hypothetical protein